jgi:hypothetical protein
MVIAISSLEAKWAAKLPAALRRIRVIRPLPPEKSASMQNE